MVDHDDNGGGGEVVEQSRDEGGSMEPIIEDQSTVVEAVGASAAATCGGDRDQNREQEVSGEPVQCTSEPEERTTEEARAMEPIVRPLDPNMTVAGSVAARVGKDWAASTQSGRASEAEPRATEEVGATGPNVEPVDSSTGARGSSIVGGSSGDARGSGAEGGDVEAIGPPLRDPAKGKGAVVKGEETTEAPFHEEDVLFRPTATTAISSSHRPITKYDVVEQLPDEALAKLLEDNPIMAR
ncbi:hypothetical protein RHMOL_Rhmol08G0152500 [Rhododendron molle]|uniref:Uncharacterized protein n=1 Tax=Rhododendron molle TaxID=49168 RepID=A0ACC0MNT0_RHOML|nr:hypothetical protein RHMOL_Rhmol08G0152500 [Rhododendron molle]